MKEKILALLIAKFAGVRKDGLAQLAGSLGLQVTTEDEAQALVDKLTADKVTDFVKDWRAEVDKEVSTANKTHEKTLKEKYNFVEKKAGDPKQGDTDPDPNRKPDQDIAKIVSEAVTAAVKPLQEKIAHIEGGKTNEARKQALEAKLKDIPDKSTFKAKVLKDFERMSFKEDADFDKYLTETDADITAHKQEIADSGLKQQGIPAFGKPDANGVSSATQEYIKSKEAKDNPLAGKDLSTIKK